MKMDWTIGNLRYATTSGSLSKVVMNVESKFEQTISNVTQANYHTTYLPAVSSADFIAWNGLNENTVKGWVENVEGSNWGAITSSIETQLSQSIHESLNPPIDEGIPW
jgi:hypothetical protein|tara:strand:+ start:94 stop:417 length:324 start_codon:yes stop_codon:yes gene_type:complete